MKSSSVLLEREGAVPKYQWAAPRSITPGRTFVEHSERQEDIPDGAVFGCLVELAEKELGSDTICANWGQTPFREFGVRSWRQAPFPLIGV
jgi:hypothetical protein